MSKNLTLLSLCALMLTACGGGGGGSFDNSPSPRNSLSAEEVNATRQAHRTMRRWSEPYTADDILDLADDFAMTSGEAQNSVVQYFYNGRVVYSHYFRAGEKRYSSEFLLDLPLGEGNFTYDIATPASWRTRHPNVSLREEGKIYNQKYSALIMFMANLDPINAPGEKYFDADHIGADTLAYANGKVPTAGTATYTGIAYGGLNERGDFRYTLNFGTRKGSGAITGLNVGRIDLLEGTLTTKAGTENGGIIPTTGTAIGGGARVQNSHDPLGYYYEANLYGPNAEEISGYVGGGNTNDKVAGFIGERGEIR